MGVISITPRSERLGNVGGIPTAHGVTTTDIGAVRHEVAGTFSPRYFWRDSHKGDQAIMAAIGGAVRGASAAASKGLRAMADARERDRARKVDDYANAVMDGMERMGADDTQYGAMPGDQAHLSGQRRGFYLRTGEGTKTLVEEWDAAFGDQFRKVGEALDADGEVRRRTLERLAGYRRSTEARLADHRNREYRRMELGSAKASLDGLAAAWRDGRDEVLPEVFAANDRLSALRGLSPAERTSAKEGLALALAKDVVDRRLAAARTEADFDAVEADVGGGMKSLPDEVANALPGGRGVLPEDARRAFADEAKRARRSWRSALDYAERAERERVAKDVDGREYAMRDLPEEKWADAYEELGRDRDLVRTDAARATRYRDHAAALRAAGEKARTKDAAASARAADAAAKAEAAANEEALSRALLRARIAEADGDLEPGDRAEARAAIWRRYTLLERSGGISATFAKSFLAEFSRETAKQDAEAMRVVYRMFGSLDGGRFVPFEPELDASGAPTASARSAAAKDETAYYSAKARDVGRMNANKETSAAEILRFGDSVRRALATLPPGADRVKFAEDACAKWRRGFMVKRFTDRLDLYMKDFMEIRAKWDEENGRRLEDDWRKMRKTKEDGSGSDGE